MRARTIAALSFLSTTVFASLGDGSRPQTAERVEAFVHTHDPCVLTRTPEILCRRFRLIDYGNGVTERVRVTLSPDERAAADAWWERPENRWRRSR